MTLKITVFEVKLTDRTFPAKGDRPARTVFKQEAFAHRGGRFPEEFQITLESAADALPVGEYTLAPQSFVINQYGDLELSRYDKKFIPLGVDMDTGEVKKPESAPATAASKPDIKSPLKAA